MNSLRALKKINELVYANVLAPGTDYCFEVRGLCTNILNQFKIL